MSLPSWNEFIGLITRWAIVVLWWKYHANWVLITCTCLREMKKETLIAVTGGNWVGNRKISSLWYFISFSIFTNYHYYHFLYLFFFWRERNWCFAWTWTFAFCNSANYVFHFEIVSLTPCFLVVVLSLDLLFAFQISLWCKRNFLFESTIDPIIKSSASTFAIILHGNLQERKGTNVEVEILSGYCNMQWLRRGGHC